MLPVHESPSSYKMEQVPLLNTFVTVPVYHSPSPPSASVHCVLTLVPPATAPSAHIPASTSWGSSSAGGSSGRYTFANSCTAVVASSNMTLQVSLLKTRMTVPSHHSPSLSTLTRVPPATAPLAHMPPSTSSGSAGGSGSSSCGSSAGGSSAGGSSASGSSSSSTAAASTTTSSSSGPSSTASSAWPGPSAYKYVSKAFL
mmetsp:Transcript_9905/g.28729  ORF Transcript_9905/g.28729 Transcript_9905/m.28729 type:complete len:200 (+) Transcript_9905:70-669(+)